MAAYETVINKTEGTFTVTFKGLACRVAAADTFVTSGVISSAGSRWMVRLYPDGHWGNRSGSSKEKGYCSCYLVNMTTQPVVASFTLLFLNSKGDPFTHYTSAGIKTFEAARTEGAVQDKDMIGATGLYEAAARLDSVTVRVTICVTGETTYRALPCRPVSEPSVTLTRRLTSGNLTDFTILAGVESEASSPDTILRIPVHKLILSQRSPVFRAMLQSGMTESSSGEVRMNDVDAGAVQEFVRFLYTDNCDATQHAEQLLALSHRYEVPELQRLCVDPLLDALTIENAANVFSLAHLYNCADLKRGTLTYIAEHAAALLQSGKFLSQLNLEQCQEVVCALAGVACSTALPKSNEEDAVAVETVEAVEAVLEAVEAVKVKKQVLT
jgi:hypothetical protein